MPNQTDGEGWMLLAPREPEYSQAWLENHAATMKPLLKAIGTYQKTRRPWFEDLPHLHLGHPLARDSYGLARLARLSGSSAASRNLRESSPTGFLIHFANFFDLLTRDKDFLPQLPTAVYVHGYDITWSPYRWCPVPYKSLGNTASYRRRLVESSSQVHFIANSKFSANRLVSAGLPSSRVHVCYLPVARSATRTAEAPSAPLRLVYLGRFVGFKGPLEVVRAVARARELGAQVTLDMIGRGPLLGRCTDQVARLGLESVVHLHGALPNDQAMQMLANSDALILHNQPDPSSGQLEAFGYAHAEALVHGVPVLTAKSGGPTEFLDDGRNSMLVAPLDVESQARQIKTLACTPNLRDELSRGAESTARKLFSREAHYGLLSTTLQSIAGE